MDEFHNQLTAFKPYPMETQGASDVFGMALAEAAGER
jgi:hypothetical protein